MSTLLPLLLILLFVSCAFGIFLHHRFLSHLRTRHPQTWESLGRPTLFQNNSVSNGRAVQRFLWRREYLVLADEEFSRFAAFLRVYFAAYIVLFVCTTAVFILRSGMK